MRLCYPVRCVICHTHDERPGKPLRYPPQDGGEFPGQCRSCGASCLRLDLQTVVDDEVKAYGWPEAGSDMDEE